MAFTGGGQRAPESLAQQSCRRATGTANSLPLETNENLHPPSSPLLFPSHSVDFLPPPPKILLLLHHQHCFFRFTSFPCSSPTHLQQPSPSPVFPSLLTDKMQPKAWFVAALLVAWVGVAQPFILLATGGAAALLGAATIGAGIGAGALVGAGIGAGAVVGTGALVGAGAVVGAKAGLAKAGLAKAGLAKVGLGTVLGSSRRDDSHERTSTYGSTIRVSKRYKRELSSLTVAEELLLQIAYDQDQEVPCGLRMVCELAARKIEELTETEAMILNLLDRPYSLDSAAVRYDEAALLGRIDGIDACVSMYQRCPNNSDQVMQQLEVFS